MALALLIANVAPILLVLLTFGFYGLIRKQAPVKALPGLVVETWILVPVAIAGCCCTPRPTALMLISGALQKPGCWYWPARPR